MDKPNPKRAIVFGSYIYSLINFRKHLIADLIARGYEVLAIAPGRDEEVIATLNKMGASFQSLSLSRTGFNPLADLSTVFSMIRIIRQFQPTLLITYTIKPVIYGNLAGSFYPNLRKVALITGLGYLETGKQSFFKRVVKKTIHLLYRYALRNLQFIAFQNPDDKQYFVDHKLVGSSTRMTITAGSGVDLSHYQRARVVTDPVTFILIARLIKAKGIVEYLEAAKILKAEYDDSVRFQLIGLLDKDNPDSIDENVLQASVQQGIVDYKGFQKDVRNLLAGASVFVLPSFYREGTPRTALEAMAMGKPIITTDNPGCRETVVDGVNGFLIPVKDVEALARAMRNFVEDREQIGKMGDESYRLAQTKFDVRLVNRHLFTFAGM